MCCLNKKEVVAGNTGWMHNVLLNIVNGLFVLTFIGNLPLALFCIWPFLNITGREKIKLILNVEPLLFAIRILPGLIFWQTWSFARLDLYYEQGQALWQVYRFKLNSAHLLFWRTDFLNAFVRLYGALARFDRMQENCNFLQKSKSANQKTWF